MPERLMRLRLPIQVWRYLQQAAELHDYDAADELVEAMLVELYLRYGQNRRPRRRATSQPAGVNGAARERRPPTD